MSPSITASRGYLAAGSRVLAVVAILLALAVPVEGAVQHAMPRHAGRPVGPQLVAATGDASLECLLDDARPHVDDPRQAIGCRTSAVRVVRPVAPVAERMASRAPRPAPRLYRKLPRARGGADLPH
jgi:hypothetical protein